MLTIFTGPMASGKSTRLYHAGRPNATRIFLGKQVRVRGDVTHARPFDLIVPNVIELEKLLEDLTGHVDVFVDEAQFLPEDHVKCLIALLNRVYHHIDLNVYVAMLDKDSDTQTWLNFVVLHKHADEVVYLRGTCEICGGRSTHTRLRRNKQPALGNVLVGDLELYQPLCWDCYVHTHVNPGM